MAESDPRWMPEARCFGMPTEMFYPEQGRGKDNSGLAAKHVCVFCPVREMCLDYAVRNNEDHGIWGGVGEDRRRYVRRQYQLAVEAKDSWIYRRALAEEAQEIGRLFGLHDEPRDWVEQHRCSNCDEWVPAGRHPVNRNGPNATCGVVSTYNKGCRCRRCDWAKSKHQRSRSGGPARDETGSVPKPADGEPETRRRKA